MAVTPLPALSRLDPDFKAKTDTFFGSQLPTFTSEVNVELARVGSIAFGSYNATSTSSVAIGTGAKTLTVETGKGFVPGQMLMVARTSSPSNYMTGQVTSYDAGTGALVLNVVIFAGSGTYTGWSISVTAVVTTSTPIGTIASVAKTPPTDGTWLACDGSVYLQASYAALYAELGLLANSPDGAGAWTQRVLPVSAYWQSVTYGDGVFVAVAYSSSIAATSPDGITWTQRTLPTSASWSSVTYGNGVFVAVAQSSTIAATSPDGITWTQRVLPVSAYWQSVTYGNGVFVAVAQSSSSIAATSPDGITWTQRTLPTSTSWYSVTYGNGVFVAVAQSSTIAATSPDGITWTQRTLPTSVDWYSVTYGNGVFVAVAQSSAIAATSPDGITWTQRTLPTSASWRSVTYGNGVFVAVANSSSIAANTSSILTYNMSTQFAVPAPAGQVGVKQYIKAL